LTAEALNASGKIYGCRVENLN